MSLNPIDSPIVFIKLSKKVDKVDNKIIRNFVVDLYPVENPFHNRKDYNRTSTPTFKGESIPTLKVTNTAANTTTTERKTKASPSTSSSPLIKTHSSNYYNPQYLIDPIVIDKIIHKITLTTIKSFKNMSKPGDYNAVAQAIAKIIPQEDYDDGSIGPVLVRLAWHASGTYDAASGTGGSNGSTMRYEMEAKDSANNGLEHARRFLEPIKQQFPWITYADLWTFAGVVAVEYMEGPKVPWKAGRVDYVDEQNVPPNGRLPDGALGQDHLRHIFYRMGFNDQEIVALCGAHNLGRTHADRSGFDGPWVPNPTKFSNTYYKLLLHEEWKLDKSPAGLPQYYDPDKELMMLPADMALILDPEFKKWVEIYAEDKELFYNDFAKAFAKLLELGVRRGPNGLAKVNEIGKINVDPAKI